MIRLSSCEAMVEVAGVNSWNDSSELSRELQGLAAAGFQTIILDLSGLRTISPLAISWILGQWEKLWESGKELCLLGCNEDIRSTFQFLRMDRYIRFLD